MDIETKDRLTNQLLQFLKFNIVGFSNVAITYGVYSLVVYFLDSYQVALIADYAVGIVYTFLMNKFITFKKGRSGKGVQEFLRIIGVYAVVFVLNWLLLGWFVDYLEWNKYLAQLLALALVTVFSYSGQKYLVFRRKGTKQHD